MNYTGKKGELTFEKDFILKLQEVGWEKEVLKDVTEEDLWNNFSQIVFENNRGRLNNVPLSDDELGQIKEYVRNYCNTPVKANTFISGRPISVRRDLNSQDKLNRDKEVYLDVFSPSEIAGGKSRYQIAEQINFNTPSQYNDRRGDLLLLINGIPLIHIELKNSETSIYEAANQIKKYAKECVFTGIFSLIQVFFAINPDDAVYFANPGDYNNYNPTFFFHWKNENNEPMIDWKDLIKSDFSILSIPEAHKLVAYYVVADKSKDVLKVVRSYQYFAIKRALYKLKGRTDWKTVNPLGGYIWCTTGGGKTMTSFKVGQLATDLGYVDKVVFVVDRKELDTQSLEEYNSFSRTGEDVKETRTSDELFRKLKSDKSDDKLIVTSIQKLKNINETEYSNRKSDLEYIKNKRILFIVDEAHRSQFGDMHERIKNHFIYAVFMGFTGTPIFTENDRGGLTTNDVFGECLATYSIANGIRDNNVLGFDPRGIKTYKDRDLRREVALRECNAKSEDEVKKDDEKNKIYRQFMSLDMASKVDNDGNVIKGIEDYIPTNQYHNNKHRNAVIEHILSDWEINSKGENGTRFHALFSVDSIPEAIEYYKLFKDKRNNGEHNLNVTALFDASIGNNGDSALEKEDALIEILSDYNKQFDEHFDRKNDPTLSLFKKDITSRLSHKNKHKGLSKNDEDKEKKIDILIVVKQLLTGFDSQFLNTLYLDSEIRLHDLIQAISRTNRVYNNLEKPFGIFRYYRKPYTMEKNLHDALKLYCEGDSDCVIVKDIDSRINDINSSYSSICKLFEKEDIKNFVILPESAESCLLFKKQFLGMKVDINGARLQGFKWDNEHGKKLNFDEYTFKVLTQRYKDLIVKKQGNNSSTKLGYDLDINLSEMDMEKIDADYLEREFKMFVVKLSNSVSEIEKETVIADFENQLGTLSEKDQKYGKMVIQDIKNKVYKPYKTFIEHIKDKENEVIRKKLFEVSYNSGVDLTKLTYLFMNTNNEVELNEQNRFSNMVSDMMQDEEKRKQAETYFGVKGFVLRGKVGAYLKDFILNKRI